MAKIYPTAKENYELGRFFVQVYNGAKPYEPNFPERLLKSNERPFYAYEEGWTNNVATPKQIVDMFYHSIEFFFEKAEDKKRFVMFTSAYVDSILDSSEKLNKEQKLEVAKCNVAIKEVQESHNAKQNYYAKKYPKRFAIVDKLMRAAKRRIGGDKK